MLTIRVSQMTQFEHGTCVRLAREELAEVRRAAPHAVLGLSSVEVEERLETAVRKAARYGFDPEDVRAFVRLCFVIGPNFDEFPRFHEILSSPTASIPTMAELFYLAEPDDWNKAAHFDILSRCQRSLGRRVGRAAPPQIQLTPLDARHTDAYFRHALHPDVWRLGRMQPLIDRLAVERFVAEQKSAPGRPPHAVVDGQGEFHGAVFLSEQNGARRVSYWIARPSWGRGFGTEALRQCTAALRQVSPSPILLTIEASNRPSIRVAEKCGFRDSGRAAGGLMTFEA